jgi:hypothetical protein
MTVGVEQAAANTPLISFGCVGSFFALGPAPAVSALRVGCVLPKARQLTVMARLNNYLWLVDLK